MPAPTNPNDFIRIQGAREHNLKDLHLQIPRQKLVVFTGLSGSGKSSLAFDTIFAEDEALWPKWTELAEFEAFFSIEMGCTCIDLLKEPLQKEAF